MSATCTASHPWSTDQVLQTLQAIFGEDLHAKRVMSLANATSGAMTARGLGIHIIGRGLAVANGLDDRHAVKQVDRLLSNPAIDLEKLLPRWCEYALRGVDEVVVNLDWTEFDADDHSTLMATAQTGHGRAIPIHWKTVQKSTLKGHRNDHEDALLKAMRKNIPRSVKVTVVADRGFGDQHLYTLLDDLEYGYIIRFRADILVTNSEGESRPAKDWMGRTGRMVALPGASVTADRTQVGKVVVLKDGGMKDIWCLVVSDPNLSNAQVKRLYGKRFTCEETFRDLKDPRFGMGLRWSRIKDADRRDRMLLVATLALGMIILLGEAGERVGLDRVLKTNTSKTRTMSLVRQGMRWFELIPTMKEERLQVLMDSFAEVLRAEQVFLAATSVGE